MKNSYIFKKLGMNFKSSNGSNKKLRLGSGSEFESKNPLNWTQKAEFNE